MYHEHVPAIRDWALERPYNFLGLSAFVLLTIRQPIQGTPITVAHVARYGHESKFLFGHKRQGFLYVRDNAADLLAAARHAVATDDAEAALHAFTAIPCLGLVKAGFLAQCLGLDVGCLDQHNSELFQLSRADVRLDKSTSIAAQAKAIVRYLDRCHALGGAAHLWDNWCAYVAGRTLDLFSSAEAVSAIHITATRGRWHS